MNKNLIEHVHDEYCTSCHKSSGKELLKKLRAKRMQMRNGRLSNTAKQYRMDMIEKKFEEKQSTSLFRNPSEMPSNSLAMEEDIKPHSDPDQMDEN